MRIASRWLALFLCLSLTIGNAMAEGAAPDTEEKTAKTPLEERIDPIYPVPDYVEWLLETAEGEIGYTEEKSGVTKYGTWAGIPAAEWCAEFLCWCVSRVDKAHQSRLLSNVYPNYSGTNVGRDWFLSQGRYIARTGMVPGWGSQWWTDTNQPVEQNSYVPQPGDWVFLSDNSKGDTSHVAMVEYCAYDANGKVMVHVIEGNNQSRPAPQSVERNAYPLDYWQILGYGTVRDLADITLRFGHSGPKVLKLQNALVAAGLLESQFTTGRYGAITTDAVKRAQRMAGIVETGIANMETQLAIESLAAQAGEKGE